MNLRDIPQLKNLRVVDSSNVVENKPSVLVLGPAKSGKTHFWTTFPKPIVCLHMDKNTEGADGAIRMYTKLGQPDAIRLLMPPSASGEQPITEDWKFYSDVFVPLARNRAFDAKTLVIEGYNYLGDALVESHRINMKERESGQTIRAVSIPGWGLVLQAHNDRLNILRSCTLPDAGGKPSYNLVVTCHLIETGDEGHKKYMPAIQGQFNAGLAKLFGSSFITQTTTKNDIVNNVMQVVGVEHRMYTVPPNIRYECGDGIGGKDKKALPPVIENTYQALCKAWGIEEER